MIQKTLTWYDFYKDKVNPKYYNYIKSRYSPFIAELQKELCLHSKILEVGSGMGNITKALIYDMPIGQYRVLDNDINILNLAKQNLYLVSVEYDQWDVLKSYSDFGDWDVIHSHGLLEHFSDDEIRLIISHQLKIGKKLIHYVPSNKYNYKSFGDERLMSPKEWFKICQPDEIKEFNDGYDLILKWRN